MARETSIKTAETHEEVSRRWAREHIERSPDVAFTQEFRDFAYGAEAEEERRLREEFT